MAVDTASTEGQAPAAETGQAPNANAQGQAPTPTEGQAPPTGTEPTTSHEGREPPTWDMVNRLRAEAAGYRTRLRDVEDRDLTETQRLAAERDELKTRAASAEERLTRYEAAAARGLPMELADRLRGSTREELEQDADKLKEQFGLAGQAPGKADFAQGARGATGGDVDFNSMIRASAGRPA